MINSRLLKNHFTSTITTLIITLLISACSAEDSLTAATADIDTDTDTYTDTNIGINTDTTANNAAVISGVDSASVVEDETPNLLQVGGKLNITDLDAGEEAFIVITHNGNHGKYGQLVIKAEGDWWYYANNDQAVIQNLARGETLNDSLTVSSLDGTTHTVVITIFGVNEANNPAVITGIDSGSVIEDVDPDGDNLLEVSGKLNITDSDPGEAAFIATTANGNYGSLAIDLAGNWTYAANNNQAVIQNLVTGATLNDSLTVNSLDGTTHTVVITIFGVDENDTTANIDLSWVAPAEREDNTPIALSEITGYKIYYGTTQGQYPNSVTINDGTAVGHTLQNFTAGTYYFVVTTIDTEGRESQFSTEVIITI